MKLLAICQFLGGSLDGSEVPITVDEGANVPPRGLWARKCVCGQPGCTFVLLHHEPPGEPYHLESGRYVAGPPAPDEFPVPPRPQPAAESATMPAAAATLPFPPEPYLAPAIVRWACLFGWALLLLGLALWTVLR